MIHVYLDWNVFDKIEKKSEPVFPEIEKLIKDQIIITPYSNAHINDLVRGYEKNQSYIGGHLSTLSCLTNNLCIVQYWGHKNTTWHYRDVVEFFNSSLDDIQTSSKSFSELLNWDETGLWELHLSMLRLQKLPEEFKQMFKENPIFNNVPYIEGSNEYACFV